jgi:TatD family-associated radical SAM protein
MNTSLAYPIRDALYLNITDRCTLVCAFCPKHNGSTQVHEHDLYLPKRPELAEMLDAIGDPSGYREVVFCGYGEPTLRLNLLLQVATAMKDKGMRVRINTDGLANLVHKRNVLPEMQGLVDALSVSLNAHNEAIYQRHCQPQLANSFAAVQEFLRLAPTYVPEVTATAIDGLEGVDIDACERLATELGVAFRRRHLNRVG